MEVNRDCVVGKIPGEPHGTIYFGEGIRKLALLREDVFRSELVSALPATVLGRAGEGYRDKREEDSESDGGGKNHVRRKTTNEDDKSEGEDWITIARNTQESEGGDRITCLQHVGLYTLEGR